MNTVTKEEYWSIILNNPAQIGQITTEDTEFNRRINDVNLVLSNTFINSSDENLISKWETSLYIDGIEGKTITERKADILYKLCEKNYVPVSIIKRFLLNLIGDENRFVVEFIKDENKLVIHTDRISDDMNEAVTSLVESVKAQNIEVVRYNHNMEISWRDINKYAECVTLEDVKAVNPDYKNDLTSDAEWVYPLYKIKNADLLFRNNNTIVTLYLYMNECTSALNMIEEWWGNKNLKKVYGCCPKLTQASGMFQYRAGLFYVDLKVPALATANQMFNSCILNKESVIRFVDSIPSYTSGSHPLTIGIHIDHQTDEEVLAAISNAESKGWTLTVQWNGTPTSTASTMAMGSLIYAKVGEQELPDGTTERVLDWGHYVTDETGYETFRSLESAYKYFNLKQPTEI